MNTIQQKFFQQSLVGIPGTTNTSHKLAPAVVDTYTKGNGKQMVPMENPNAIRARTNANTPLAAQSLAAGLELEQTHTVVVDLSAVAAGVGTTKILLWDHHKFAQIRLSIANPVPAGSLYIGSAAENYYASVQSTLCSETMHLYGITVRSTLVDGAITEKQSVNNPLKIHVGNGTTGKQTLMKLNQWYDPNQFDASKQVIPFTGEFGRLDAYTAWEYDGQNGHIIEIVLFLKAGTRD